MRARASGGEVGGPGDPVDLVGEGGVEDAGVVGPDDEVHAGVEEAVHGVQLRAGDAAEAQVRAGAGLDDHAQAGQLAEDETLAPAHLLEAVVVVGPPAEGRGVAPAQALPLRLQVRRGHLHAGVLQAPAVAQVVGDLVQPLGHRLPQVGAAPPLHGGLRIQAQGDAVAQALRPELGGLVTPAHGALQGLVEVDLAHVVEDLESALADRRRCRPGVAGRGRARPWGGSPLPRGRSRRRPRPRPVPAGRPGAAAADRTPAAARSAAGRARSAARSRRRASGAMTSALVRWNSTKPGRSPVRPKWARIST